LIPSWAAGRPSEAMHASHPASSSTSGGRLVFVHGSGAYETGIVRESVPPDQPEGECRTPFHVDGSYGLRRPPADYSLFASFPVYMDGE